MCTNEIKSIQLTTQSLLMFDFICNKSMVKVKITKTRWWRLDPSICTRIWCYSSRSYMRFTMRYLNRFRSLLCLFDDNVHFYANQMQQNQREKKTHIELFICSNMWQINGVFNFVSSLQFTTFHFFVCSFSNWSWLSFIICDTGIYHMPQRKSLKWNQFRWPNSSIEYMTQRSALSPVILMTCTIHIRYSRILWIHLYAENNEQQICQYKITFSS